ncbi:MAG: hypothetical protein ACI38Q_03070, partial [Candidatus Bruticola sp.]
REEAKQNICLTQLIKYRGAHGNLRLWRVCKSSLLFGANGAVLNEAGSFRLYRREYVHNSNVGAEEGYSAVGSRLSELQLLAAAVEKSGFS